MPSTSDWEKIEQYLQNGQLQVAETQCQTILQQQPDNATAYKLLGNIYQQQGDNTAAKQAYETAISLSPDFAEAYANLGNIYLQRQTWQAAIDSYQTAIRLNPHLAGVYRNLAKLWQAKGDQNQATDCWQTAYELEPEKLTAEGYFAVGNRYFQQKQLEAARDCYQQAIQHRDSYPAAWQNLGEVYFWQRQWENAIACFEKVIRYHPNIAAAYRGLAKTYQKLNQPQKSSQAWFEALQLQPEWGTSQEHVTLGNNFLGYGDWEKAKQCYQQAIAIQPDCSQAYHNLAEIHFTQQQWQDAIDCYRREIEINPSEAAANSYWKLIQALVKTRQWEKAIDCCQQATQHFPEDGYFYQQLGWLYQQQGEWEAAIESYQQAIDCDASLIGCYIELGEIWLQKQCWQEAVEVYQQALNIDSEKAILYGRLGKAFYNLQQWEAAVVNLQKAIELEPNHAWYYHKLGECWQSLRQWKAALAAYQQAIENGSQNPWIYQKMGDVWYTLQNWEQAAKAYQQWEQKKKKRDQLKNKAAATVEPLAVGKTTFRRIIYNAYRPGGLCNRLRVLASCLSLGYFWQIPVYMRWLPENTCKCFFEDIYQPVCETVKADTIEKWLTAEPSQTLHITRMTADIGWLYKQYLKSDVERLAYDQKYLETIQNMKLQPSLQTAIEQFIENNWQYPIIGVHIRRTDHYKSKYISSDDRFFQTMERHLQQGIEKFFLSTDNSETQTKFREKFGNRILTYSQDFNQSQLRQTSQQTAAIDLHLLANTQKIVGSYNSSFSRYAADLGNIPLDLPWETASSEVS